MRSAGKEVESQNPIAEGVDGAVAWMEGHFFVPTEEWTEVRRFYAPFGEVTRNWEEGDPVVRLLALSVVAMPAGMPVGVVCGLFHRERGEFELTDLRLLPGHRGRAVIVSALRMLLAHAGERFSPRRFRWQYALGQGEADARPALLEEAAPPWLGKPCRAWAGIESVLATERMRGLRHNAPGWGDGDLLKAKGYALCPWRECGAEIHRQIRAIAAEDPEDISRLLPFVGERYDPETSFVLLTAKDGRVAGWAICNRAGERTMEICGWYVLPSLRAQGTGLWLGAYMMRLLQDACDTLRFQARGTSMQRMAQDYLADAAIQQRDIYRLEAEIS